MDQKNQSQVTHDSYPISLEDYLRNEVWKGSKESHDKLSEHMDRFAKKTSIMTFNRMVIKRKGTEPKVIQPTENVDIVCNEWPMQSTAKKSFNKKELHKQTQNQENTTRSGQISRKPKRLSYY